MKERDTLLAIHFLAQPQLMIPRKIYADLKNDLFKGKAILLFGSRHTSHFISCFTSDSLFLLDWRPTFTFACWLTSDFRFVVFVFIRFWLPILVGSLLACRFVYVLVRVSLPMLGWLLAPHAVCWFTSHFPRFVLFASDFPLHLMVHFWLSLYLAVHFWPPAICFVSRQTFHSNCRFTSDFLFVIMHGG